MRTYSQEIEKLRNENEFLKKQMELSEALSKQETKLKNLCFVFLIRKKLYKEWEEWTKTEEAKRGLLFLLSRI